jgi:serine/threonine protein kinase
MDYCEKGSLLEWDPNSHRFTCPWEQKINENLIKSILHQLAFAIKYLDSCKILHCDIKPQNILVTKDYTVKIADFGQAIVWTDTDFINKNHGTYHFMSPECITGTIYLANGSFSGKAAEIWALGVTLYSFIYKTLPYDGENLNELMRNIENTSYYLLRINFPPVPKISQDLQRVLSRLLDKNPSTRLTVEELLSDKWVNS